MAGLLAGAGAAWLIVADPGRGHGASGTLRADVDDAVARLSVVESRLGRVDEALRVLDERIAAATKAAPTASVDQLRAVAADLAALRDALTEELKKVDARLGDLRRRIDEQNTPRAAHDGPLTEEEEDAWAARSRDPDPGVRCSALKVLGRARTERSVHVSVERLADEDPEVVWYAVRNVGRFKERDAAGKLAALLAHAAVEVRAVAYEALVAIGAPKDTGYEATASAEKRRAPADALKRWAEGP